MSSPANEYLIFSFKELQSYGWWPVIGIMNPRHIHIFHGSGMLLMWAGFSVAGVIVARYFRHYSWWLYVHVTFQKMSFFCTLPAALIGAYASSRYYEGEGVGAQFAGSYNHRPEISTSAKLHIVLGPIVTVLTILQGFLGKLRLHDLKFKCHGTVSCTPAQRDTVGLVHAVCGKILLALAMTQLFTGASNVFWKEEMVVRSAFAAYWGSLFCLFLGLEVFYLPQTTRLPLLEAFKRAKAIDEAVWDAFEKHTPWWLVKTARCILATGFLTASNTVEHHKHHSFMHTFAESEHMAGTCLFASAAPASNTIAGNSMTADMKRLSSMARDADKIKNYKWHKYNVSDAVGWLMCHELYKVLLFFFIVFVGIVGFFGLLFAIEPEGIYTPHGNLPGIDECCWLSLQTFTTIGYGSLSPKNKWAQFVSSACAFVGQLYTAVLTTVFLANLVTPRSHWKVADVVTVHRDRKGRTVLEARYLIAPGTGYANVMTQFQVERIIPSGESSSDTVVQSLHIEQPFALMRAGITSVTHVIDETSPLHDLVSSDMEGLRSIKVITLRVLADDTRLKSSIPSITQFTPKDILLGRVFEEMVVGEALDASLLSQTRIAPQYSTTEGDGGGIVSGRWDLQWIAASPEVEE